MVSPPDRQSTVLNRLSLTHTPVVSLEYLWRDLHYEGRSAISIEVEGQGSRGQWSALVDFQFVNSESIDCTSVTSAGGPDITPHAAKIALLPPMSGLASEEAEVPAGRIDVLIGEGCGGSSLLAGFSRASISVASRATQPITRSPRLRATSAACMRSASSVTANSAKLVPAKAGGAGKRGLARDFPAFFPAAYAAQRLVDREAFDEGDGGWYAQHRFRHEAACQGASVLGLTSAPTTRRGRHEGFQTDGVEHMDQALQALGQRVEFLPHPGEQSALDMAPSGHHAVAWFRHDASDSRREAHRLTDSDSVESKFIKKGTRIFLS